MTKYLLLFLLLSCATDRLVPFEHCGEACGCNKVWVCGEETTCEGTGPVAETCDGVDNDCDGVVDEYIFDTCYSACGKGIHVCNVEGKGTWSDCSAVQPTEEVCNGKDDDCNGIADDSLSVRLCGVENNPIQFGECRPGVERCEAGKVACYGAVKPSPEVCNGKDDDCNGLIDDTGADKPIDLVVIVDCSGSMSTLLPEIQRALAAVSFNGRSALVVSPGPAGWSDYIPLVYEPFPNGLARVGELSASGGGREPSLDALWLAENDHFGLGYVNKLVVVMFTDEEPQTYLTPMVMMLKGTSYIFTSQYMAIQWSQWGVVEGIDTPAIGLTRILNKEKCQ